MNKKIFFVAIIILTCLATSVKSQLFVSVGTNYGGANPTKQTEGSSAKIYPGVFLSFGKEISLSEKLYLKPQISVDYRMFNYFANQTKDTIVEAEIMGVIANVPTYYKANIQGKMRLLGLYAEIPLEYRFIKSSAIVFGIYGSALPYKSDFININITIGEGGLLPDIDSSYNNKHNINTFDAGLSLGGKFIFNNKMSLFITGYRSLSRFYKMNAVKDPEGNDIPFFYTQVRFGLEYLF